MSTAELIATKPEPRFLVSEATRDRVLLGTYLTGSRCKCGAHQTLNVYVARLGVSTGWKIASFFLN